jgi:hypothetical protein
VESGVEEKSKQTKLKKVPRLIATSSNARNSDGSGRHIY